MNNQSGEDKYSLPSFNSQGIVKSCVVEDNSIEEREKEISKDITFNPDTLCDIIITICNNLKTIMKEETMSKSNLPNRGQHNMFFDMLKLAKYEGVFHNSEFIVNTGTSSLVVPYDVVSMYIFCLDLYAVAVEIPGYTNCKSHGECFKEVLSEFHNTLSPEQQFMVVNRDTKKEERVVEEKTEEGTKITFYIIRQERKDLIDEIAEVTKTLLSFENKTSWMYNQTKLHLEYLNAKFALIEEWYQKNK